MKSVKGGNEKENSNSTLNKVHSKRQWETSLKPWEGSPLHITCYGGDITFDIWYNGKKEQRRAKIIKLQELYTWKSSEILQ
jgi:predicted SpoU family rRNA methylase